MMSVRKANGPPLSIHRPMDLMELRLEVFDSHGESLLWQFMKLPSETTQGRMTIVIRDRFFRQLNPDDLRFRYWDLMAAAIDLPFTFKDIPTP